MLFQDNARADDPIPESGTPISQLPLCHPCRYFNCDGNTTNGCEAGPAVAPLHGTVGCVDQKLAVTECDAG
jgi:hypothetical protein